MAERAAEMVRARRSTLGSTAAGITAVITAGGAVMIVVTISFPSRKGEIDSNFQTLHFFWFKFLYINGGTVPPRVSSCWMALFCSLACTLIEISIEI